MSDLPLTPSGMDMTAAVSLPVVVPAAEPERKGIDLAVIKKGAKDFLDFMDGSKEDFYAYLYHRTGSEKLARTLLSEIYSLALSRALSFWWFGTLNLTLLLDHADKVLGEASTGEADLDRVYLPSLVWLSPEEKSAASSLHDSLWTLPHSAQRLLILSLFVGLSDQRIGELLGFKPEDVTQQLGVAKELLMTRWQPVASMAGKLQSLVFVPSLDLAAETNLRFSMVEKYNALRFRKYQWVIIGGLFAVMSNVIVASVLAFAVIVQPPTSLRGVRTQVASLDAVLLKHQMELSDAKRSVNALINETRGVAAMDAARDLTNLGLGTALESLKTQQTGELDANRLMKLMERASTAMQTILKPIEVAVEALWKIL